MNELDRQIRITLHNLATLQAAKIVQLEQHVEKLEAKPKRAEQEKQELMTEITKPHPLLKKGTQA